MALFYFQIFLEKKLVPLEHKNDNVKTPFLILVYLLRLADFPLKLNSDPKSLNMAIGYVERPSDPVVKPTHYVFYHTFFKFNALTQFIQIFNLEKCNFFFFCARGIVPFSTFNFTFLGLKFRFIFHLIRLNITFAVGKHFNLVIHILWYISIYFCDVFCFPLRFLAVFPCSIFDSTALLGFITNRKFFIFVTIAWRFLRFFFSFLVWVFRLNFIWRFLYIFCRDRNCRFKFYLLTRNQFFFSPPPFWGVTRKKFE